MTRPFFKLNNGQNSSDYTSWIQWNASTCKGTTYTRYSSDYTSTVKWKASTCKQKINTSDILYIPVQCIIF